TAPWSAARVCKWSHSYASPSLSREVGMIAIVTILHIVACTFLISVVLLQQGKGADMGAVFGGSSSTIFGSGGAGNFLTRLTTAMAVIFMLTSMTLTYTGARHVTSTV